MLPPSNKLSCCTELLPLVKKNARNEAIQSKTVQRAVARFVDVTDLKDVTPHTLRHNFAKSLIDSGVSLDKVATLLGHSNLLQPAFIRPQGYRIWKMLSVSSIIFRGNHPDLKYVSGNSMTFNLMGR